MLLRGFLIIPPESTSHGLAQNMARHPGPLGVFFRRQARRKCWNIAVCATAHKLVTIAWLMLRNNEPYRYANPSTKQQKLSRLRVAVTGKLRKPERKGRQPGVKNGANPPPSCRQSAKPTNRKACRQLTASNNCHRESSVSSSHSA